MDLDAFLPAEFPSLAAYARAARDFALEHEALHATHADEFFASGAWGALPEGLRQELSFPDAVAAAALQSPPSLPEPVARYVRRAASLSLPRAPRGGGGAPPPLPGCSAGRLPQRLSRGLCGKKEHEVLRMGALVAETCRENSIRTVVNLGEGKGYLSLALAELCGVDTVGVDCVAQHAEAARRREAAARGGEGAPRGRMRSVTHRVELGMGRPEWDALLGEAALGSACVVGLHACGDLGSCATQLFASGAPAALVLAPCCHHALTPAGFPMSALLRELGVGLSVVSRMLACAPSTRWGSTPAEEQRAQYLLHYYRAALCGLQRGAGAEGEQLHLPAAVLRQSAARAARGELSLRDFAAAAAEAAARRSRPDGGAEGPAPSPPGDAELAEWEVGGAGGARRFAQFVTWLCLRRAASGVLEGLLVADRLQYLREQGCARSTLLPLFDPVVSPRSLVLVAIREAAGAQPH